ncbi:MAG: DUF2283 domain-containing protein [Candidatus Caldarchaeum sp.]|nr:DUF2283 domain-containing protein [Candidatus Caldarchaeum sp.]MCS7136982.1 DUF2283 domain-containing protein [Candidatus Caldarchaeum sp.]MDW7977356.1 DUF2283 domain-containing protein [Candidatus Caldarchaeum sp.]MDW8359687.1 DUF2283 domain-containing protein [Candidatus Caldarchaeum sp.]
MAVYQKGSYEHSYFAFGQTSSSSTYRPSDRFQITVDDQAGAVYIYLKPGSSAKSVACESTAVFDFDEKGELIGVEILVAKRESMEKLRRLIEKHGD